MERHLNLQVKSNVTRLNFKGGPKRALADFGDELLLLVFPEFPEQVRDVIALDHFLGQLQLPQISYYVRKHKPNSVKQAVDFTLGVESSRLSIDQECKISENTSTNVEPIQQLERVIKVLEDLQLRLVNLESVVQCTNTTNLRISQIKGRLQWRNQL